MIGFAFDDMDENTWITAKGRRVRVDEMDLGHLTNTIRLLRRRQELLRLLYLLRMSRYIADAPDGAAMACEMEANHICDMRTDEFLKIIVPPFPAMLRSLCARMS